MRLFKCIIDDGCDIFKTFVPARNKNELLKVYGGNGDFIIIEDVTNLFINNNIINAIEADLQKAGWDEIQIRFIKAILERNI